MKSRFLFYVAVHAFVVQDGKVLLSKRHHTGYRDGEYSVPAGHVDGGGTIAAAMMRELQEEIGIELSTTPTVSHVMHRMLEHEERIDYFFSITSWKGQPINREPEKCAEISWYEFDSLPSVTIPYVRAAFMAINRGEKFSEFVEHPDK
jgi:mutator protein MutT